MKRRDFVRSGLLAAGYAGFGIPGIQGASPVFPLGVASGDPRPHGIVLWTKIAPELAPAGAVPVEYQVSGSPLFLPGETIFGTIEIVPDRDFTVKVVLDYPYLQPFTSYYYRFRLGDAISPIGRFKTLPLPNQFVPQLRLGFLSCQDYTNGYFVALGKLIQENVDYVIHLGDYIYESIGDPDFQVNQVRPIGQLPSGGSVAASLEDYRFLYSIYHSDPALQALHSSCAFITVWDDHEFRNDSWQDRHADNTPTPGEPQPELRQAANQAWSEYLPVATSFDTNKPPLKSLRIYRSFTFGTLAKLVMTDLRLYRDGPPCGYDEADRLFTTGCPEHQSPTRTMMGPVQKEWFFGEMNDSGAVWNLWGNEVMAMGLKIGYDDPVTYLSLDQWDGYPAERESIMTALSAVQNVVAMTGDLHSFGAGYLQPDYLSWGAPRAGVEFVGGSVTASNFAEVLGWSTRSPSAPVSREVLARAFPGGLISLLVRLNNPHIKFFDSATHGYGVLDINPFRVRCDLRNVSAIESPLAGISTLASFVVPRDRVELIKA